MTENIKIKLKEIESTENVRILYACESGSRAWGFASEDSDFDVRFIYVMSKKDYITINPKRDVIELPVDEVLDINGWDLQKALSLFHKSNPILFEWLQSPIVYQKNDLFLHDMQQAILKYFQPKHTLLHYLHMGKRNYQEYFKQDLVKLKKYFYVLRPILCCQWIIENGTMPPMEFQKLLVLVNDKQVKTEIDKLLSLKLSSTELDKINKVSPIEEFISTNFEVVESYVSDIWMNHKAGISDLDEILWRWSW